MLDGNPDEHTVHELLWSAADNGCPEIVALALPHLERRPLDERGWHWVLMQPPRGASNDPARNEDHFACLELLLKYGADPNAGRKGATILHFTAARQGLDEASRVRFAEMLLDHGAGLDLRDDLLWSTPLGWACRWGRLEMAELLIARGAPVEEAGTEPWAQPRAWARKMGHDEIVTLLG